MVEEMKELKGITIEVREKSVRFIQEKKTNPWWRKSLDRKKEGMLCPQISQHFDRILFNMVQGGNKYNFYMTNLPPNPRSSQGKKKTTYKKYLISYLKKKGAELKKFKDKEVFVYIAIYLRPERYETHDVDNFPKAIIDSLKEFMGDDNKVVSCTVDKFKLENYPQEDLDFLEQVLIVVTEPKGRSEVLKK